MNITSELEALKAHMDALSVEWDRTSRKASTGVNARKDAKYSEYCRGRSDGYAVAAGKIASILEGMK